MNTSVNSDSANADNEETKVNSSNININNKKNVRIELNSSIAKKIKNLNLNPKKKTSLKTQGKITADPSL